MKRLDEDGWVMEAVLIRKLRRDRSIDGNGDRRKQEASDRGLVHPNLIPPIELSLHIDQRPPAAHV